MRIKNPEIILQTTADFLGFLNNPMIPRINPIRIKKHPTGIVMIRGNNRNHTPVKIREIIPKIFFCFVVSFPVSIFSVSGVWISFSSIF